MKNTDSYLLKQLLQLSLFAAAQYALGNAADSVLDPQFCVHERKVSGEVVKKCCRSDPVYMGIANPDGEGGPGE